MPDTESSLRVDVLLDRLCLMRSRSQAARACAEGRVFVNRQVARASREVRSGDRVLFRDRLLRHEEEVVLLEIPRRGASKPEARSCYERVYRRALNPGSDAVPGEDERPEGPRDEGETTP